MIYEKMDLFGGIMLDGCGAASTRTRGFECQGGDEDHEINELYQSPAREDIMPVPIWNR